MILRDIAASMRHLRAGRAAVAASAAGVQPHAAAPTDTMVQSFTYVPATGTTVNFRGGSKVILPAMAICEPKSAGYGAGTWERACSVATNPITFTVRAWATSAGNTQVTVSPDVRFVPGKIASVYLPATNGSPTTLPVIQWCTATMTQCVDEGASDPSMVTLFDAKTKLAYRRIKHFSGYNVGVGRGASAAARQETQK